jgi:hypothetical protein
MSPALAAILICGLVGQAGPPAASPTDFAQTQRKKWNELCASQAASYDILVDGDREQPLELAPKPVLFWSNPIRGGETNGAVFVWTRQGRAEAVGTVFSFLDRRDPKQRVIAHSFHSLSLQPLAAQRDGRPSWSILGPGIRPEPIPDAPKPAGNAPLRLTQIRELARDFTAASVHNGVEQELRLLPQPIFRNLPSSDSVLDGALFTFVTGTDPELMLVIESRESPAGPVWQYAAGRFSDLTLKLRHKQVELWTHERTSVAEPNAPYLSGRVGTRSSTID